MEMVEKRSVSFSLILHGIALVVLAVGLPILLPPHTDPTPLVMSVDVLPIGDVSNVKPSDKPIQKEQHAPAPKPKPAPTPPQPPKPATPPTPAKPVPTPPAPKAPAPPEEKHFDPTEGTEKLPKPKPEEKKPEPPKPQEKPSEKKPDAKPQNQDFEALLKNLKKEESKAAPAPTPAPATTPGKDKTNQEENKTKSDAPYDASKPLSISEKDAIRSQFIPCWRAPIGAKDASSLAARVKVELQQDGTVKTATLAADQQGRYSSDPYFRAAADAAVRAVYKCSPLKNLPADKYGTWSTMEINFDPKDMM